MPDGIDLFGGLGGTTEGAIQAGVKVRWAANHWQAAVHAHKKNHPEVEVSCQDLKQANFLDCPKTNIVYASPECRGHSHARGADKPHHDDSRATAYAVLSCIEAVAPDIVIVENVVEFRNWGPRDRQTQKILSYGKGHYFNLWKENLACAGYQLSENIIDSADLGVPQNRVRMFVVGVHRDVHDGAIEIPRPRVKHKPASSIINFNLPMKKIDVCDKTLDKIHFGRLRLGKRFLIQYNGQSQAQPLDEPLGSVTTVDRFGLVDGNYFRMLAIEEYKRAMGFPEKYWLPDNHRVALKMLGNAVVPAVAKYVTEYVIGKVYKKRAA